MFDTLSPTQRQIVFDMSGKFVVRACPGSGKTYCVSARLARLMKDWKEGYSGIATVSFTNVAWQEIEKKLKEEFRIPNSITYPHFLGTLDSFINKFIFLQFGHLVMKCNKRPVLVGEPHSSWTLRNFERDPKQYFDKCSFDINGELIPIAHAQSFNFSWKKNKNGSTNGHVKNLLAAKNALVNSGYANQSDANYFAMRILERFPFIRKSIALRFPTLIVDEAQDTSEVQMRIIDLLEADGLNEIMLVGDPDQAIFEWNAAKPALFKNKIHEWNNEVLLNENRRSSQRICNRTFNFSSLANASTSIDAVIANWEFEPNVVIYNNNLSEIVDSFLDVCTANQIKVSSKTVSVIYRGKGMINEIAGVQKIPFGLSHWHGQNKFTKDFVRGKYLYDNGDFKAGFKLIEKAIIKMRNNLSVCSQEMIDKKIEKVGLVNFRTLVYNYLKILPATNITLGEWITSANAAFEASGIQYILEVNPASNKFSFSQIFLNEDDFLTESNYRIGTVHSVKGETFDATLLILKEKVVHNIKYTTLIANYNPPSEHEELRIAYVGMTRPRKVLIIAVPNAESKAAWENKLYANN